MSESVKLVGQSCGNVVISMFSIRLRINWQHCIYWDASNTISEQLVSVILCNEVSVDAFKHFKKRLSGLVRLKDFRCEDFEELSADYDECNGRWLKLDAPGVMKLNHAMCGLKVSLLRIDFYSSFRWPTFSSVIHQHLRLGQSEFEEFDFDETTFHLIVGWIWKIFLFT